MQDTLLVILFLVLACISHLSTKGSQSTEWNHAQVGPQDSKQIFPPEKELTSSLRSPEANFFDDHLPDGAVNSAEHWRERRSAESSDNASIDTEARRKAYRRYERMRRRRLEQQLRRYQKQQQKKEQHKQTTPKSRPAQQNRRPQPTTTQSSTPATSSTSTTTQQTTTSNRRGKKPRRWRGRKGFRKKGTPQIQISDTDKLSNVSPKSPGRSHVIPQSSTTSQPFHRNRDRTQHVVTKVVPKRQSSAVPRLVTQTTTIYPFISPTRALDYLTSYESLPVPKRWPVKMILPVTSTADSVNQPVVNENEKTPTKTQRGLSGAPSERFSAVSTKDPVVDIGGEDKQVTLADKDLNVDQDNGPFQEVDGSGSQVSGTEAGEEKFAPKPAEKSNSAKNMKKSLSKEERKRERRRKKRLRQRRRLQRRLERQRRKQKKVNKSGTTAELQTATSDSERRTKSSNSEGTKEEPVRKNAKKQKANKETPGCPRSADGRKLTKGQSLQGNNPDECLTVPKSEKRQMLGVADAKTTTKPRRKTNLPASGNTNYQTADLAAQRPQGSFHKTHSTTVKPLATETNSGQMKSETTTPALGRSQNGKTDSVNPESSSENTNTLTIGSSAKADNNERPFLIHIERPETVPTFDVNKLEDQVSEKSGGDASGDKIEATAQVDRQPVQGLRNRALQAQRRHTNTRHSSSADSARKNGSKLKNRKPSIVGAGHKKIDRNSSRRKEVVNRRWSVTQEFWDNTNYSSALNSSNASTSTSSRTKSDSASPSSSTSTATSLSSKTERKSTVPTSSGQHSHGTHTTAAPQSTKSPRHSVSMSARRWRQRMKQRRRKQKYSKVFTEEDDEDEKQRKRGSSVKTGSFAAAASGGNPKQKGVTASWKDKSKEGEKGSKSPFISHKTAYDFLSNQKVHRKVGIQSEDRREANEFNRFMGEGMCEIFNKHYVPTRIGGKCA